MKEEKNVALSTLLLQTVWHWKLLGFIQTRRKMQQPIQQFKEWKNTVICAQEKQMLTELKNKCVKAILQTGIKFTVFIVFWYLYSCSCACHAGIQGSGGWAPHTHARARARTHAHTHTHTQPQHYSKWTWMVCFMPGHPLNRSVGWES